MLDPQDRLIAFGKLGALLRRFVAEYSHMGPVPEEEEPLLQSLSDALVLAGQKNGWFTREQVLFAFGVWGDSLHEESLAAWLAPYNIRTTPDKTVALILAGNIPLVGFHDLMSVLISGHRAQVKLSSNDDVLLPAIMGALEHLVPGMQELVTFKEDRLEDYDAVIATGSNNTARYFAYYFGKKPHIIRKSRNSVAVLSGKETKENLKALGQDILQYYGLGCRSVSKIFVPEGYDFKMLFEGLQAFQHLAEEQKYRNNYDYNKAIYLMSEFPFLDNGFLLLKEDTGYASPIGTLFYEYYRDRDELNTRLQADQELIQCIVTESYGDGEIPFGQSQHPALNAYADGIDTVEFLLKR